MIRKHTVQNINKKYSDGQSIQQATACKICSMYLSIDRPETTDANSFTVYKYGHQWEKVI